MQYNKLPGSAQGIDTTKNVAFHPIDLLIAMHTIAVHIASGPQGLGSLEETQSPFSPYLAHLVKTDSFTFLRFRQMIMQMEIDVCGSLSKPKFVVKDHCKALAKSESMAWHNMTPGVCMTYIRYEADNYLLLVYDVSVFNCRMTL